MNKHYNRKLLIMLVLLCIPLIICSLFIFNYINTKEIASVNNSPTTYIPFGDSFTIGLGVAESHRLPNIMVENFAREGIYIKILENPAVSGYTIRNTIDYELPILKKLKPDFITIFIGTNDSFAQIDVKDFEKDYKKLLDKTQKLLLNPKKIVLITIPDYSKFPALKGSQDDYLAKSIATYNKIIKEESIRRGLILADIYPISQNMKEDEFFIADGIHPSKAGYMKWEKIINQKVSELLLQ